jgi:hypothetical protein
MFLLLLAMPWLANAGDLPAYKGADLEKQKAALTAMITAVKFSQNLSPCEDLEYLQKSAVSYQPNITTCPKMRRYFDRIYTWSHHAAESCRAMPQEMKTILSQPTDCNRYGAALKAGHRIAQIRDNAMKGLNFMEDPKSGDSEYAIDESPEMKTAECGIALTVIMYFQKHALGYLESYFRHNGVRLAPSAIVKRGDLG